MDTDVEFLIGYVMGYVIGMLILVYLIIGPKVVRSIIKNYFKFTHIQYGENGLPDSLPGDEYDQSGKSDYILRADKEN